MSFIYSDCLKIWLSQSHLQKQSQNVFYLSIIRISLIKNLVMLATPKPCITKTSNKSLRKNSKPSPVLVEMARLPKSEPTSHHFGISWVKTQTHKRGSGFKESWNWNCRRNSSPLCKVFILKRKKWLALINNSLHPFFHSARASFSWDTFQEILSN